MAFAVYYRILMYKHIGSPPYNKEKGRQRKMKKAVLAVLAVSFAAFLAMPAAAETFTTADGVLSVELPNDDWKEIEDSNKWVVLSDGDDIITIEHYSNGEKLPDMSVADDHYVNVYQAIASTQNEVFIITGGVVDSEKISEVANIIVSAKVLKYDTKLAVHKEDAPAPSEFSVAAADKTMYVTASGLNVRKGWSTEEELLGTLEYGTQVHVTGVVQKNGADYGWNQISYGSGSGYVSANFLSDSAPAQASNSSSGSSSGSGYSGNVKTVYDEFGESTTLYEGTDGLWRDKSGTAYTRLSDTEFQVYEGTKRVYTYDISAVTNDYAPEEYSDSSDGVVTAYDEFGEAVTLYESSDGYWYDREGTAYIRHSANDFQVNEGNKHLTVY